MSHVELTSFVQRYALPPAALDELYVLMARVMRASTERLRNVLDGLSADTHIGDVKGTLEGVLSGVERTLDSTEPSNETMAASASSAMAVGQMRSIFVDLDGDTMEGARVSLHAEDEAKTLAEAMCSAAKGHAMRISVSWVRGAWERYGESRSAI